MTMFQNEAVKRRLLIGVCILGVVAAGYWVYQRLTHVYTDDARIAADMINLASEVSGTLVEFTARAGQEVSQGEVLARLDDRKTRQELTGLQAGLAELEARQAGIRARHRMVSRQAEGEMAAARSRLEAAQARLRSAESDHDLREAEWQRAESLRQRELLSIQDWEQARNAWQQAQETTYQAIANVAAGQAELVEAEARALQREVLEHELRALEQQHGRLQAEMQRLEVVLDEHILRAPINGVVDETFVKRGEHVSVGQRLLLMHDPDQIWVDANVKETEVRRLQPGQRVRLKVDAFPSQKLEGELVRIGDAATSEFALLPSTNPSGNFTKITQRLPLKIRLPEHELWLRPGMMVEVAIDVRRR